MAQLTTTYSKELKEKIFILKGEEGYARTTDTLLDEILHNGERLSDWNTHKEYMLLEFRIDVLRDLGASQIVLYDNDEVIGVYDFEVGTHTIEFKYTSPLDDTRLKLEYGIEHNIYARYMGNKQCLKSTSKKYSFYEPIPERFESSISFSGLDTNYDTGDDVEFTATLSAYQVDNKTLNVYVNDTKYGEVTTDVNGTASVSITDLTDDKYTISVEYMGGQYSTSASKIKDISIGYVVEIIAHSDYVINNSPSEVSVYAHDYLDEPKITNITIEEYTDGWGWEQVSQMQSTDGNGHVTVDPAYLTAKPFRAMMGSNEYYSESYTIPKYDNVTVSMNYPDPVRVSTNYSSTLTGSLTNVTAPVKVSINQGVGDVMTDSNGNFTATYNGSSRGSITVTASVYGAEDSKIINDVIQYWKAPSGSLNVDYQTINSGVQALSNGWKIETYSDNKPSTITLNNVLDTDYNYLVEYNIVSVYSNSPITYISLDGSVFVPIQFKVNDQIEIVYDYSNSSVKFYKNKTLVTTSDLHYSKMTMIFSTESDPYTIQPFVGRMVINNLKFTRWDQ